MHELIIQEFVNIPAEAVVKIYLKLPVAAFGKLSV